MEIKVAEFCMQCGAGIGKHRREGEGTCPNCEDQSTVPSKASVVDPMVRTLTGGVISPVGIH